MRERAAVVTFIPRVPVGSIKFNWILTTTWPPPPPLPRSLALLHLCARARQCVCASDGAFIVVVVVVVVVPPVRFLHAIISVNRRCTAATYIQQAHSLCDGGDVTECHRHHASADGACGNTARGKMQQCSTRPALMRFRSPFPSYILINCSSCSNILYYYTACNVVEHGRVISNTAIV